MVAGEVSGIYGVSYRKNQNRIFIVALFSMVVLIGGFAGLSAGEIAGLIGAVWLIGIIAYLCLYSYKKKINAGEIPKDRAGRKMPVPTKKEKVKISDSEEFREFWENLKLGDGNYDIFRQAFRRNILSSGVKFQSLKTAASAFEIFCRGAISFYDLKGNNVRDLKLVNFYKRLCADGYTSEFFGEFWLKYYQHQVASQQALDVMHTIIEFSNAGIDQIKSDWQEKDEFSNEMDEWADIITCS